MQVEIGAVSGEIVTSNNRAQENIDNFEAVRDPVLGVYGIPPREIYLLNPFINEGSGEPRPFYLTVDSELPPDWSYAVAGGESPIYLAPGELRRIPVSISVPPGSPIGQSHLLAVDAATEVTMLNPDNGIPHQAFHVVGGVILTAQTVDPSRLTLNGGLDGGGSIAVNGVLDPAHATIVALDYTDPLGVTRTRLVGTDPAGNYSDTYPPDQAGNWLVRAIWQGDLDHAGAVSDPILVQVPAPVGIPNDQPPANQPPPDNDNADDNDNQDNDNQQGLPSCQQEPNNPNCVP